MSRIAFDVDGTLIRKGSDGRDIPRYEIIALVKFFLSNGDRVFVWSGGGEDYAKEWSMKLGLYGPDGVRIIGKSKAFEINLCFDDEVVELADVNIQI